MINLINYETTNERKKMANTMCAWNIYAENKLPGEWTTTTAANE